jgi:hypothetical protein
MTQFKWLLPALLSLLLVSGWAWFYLIPHYKDQQQKKEMAAFFDMNVN